MSPCTSAPAAAYSKQVFSSVSVPSRRRLRTTGVFGVGCTNFAQCNQLCQLYPTDEDCVQPPPPPQPSGPTNGGNGDPHFTTWDGQYYDFYGKGSFWLTYQTLPAPQQSSVGFSAQIFLAPLQDLTGTALAAWSSVTYTQSIAVRDSLGASVLIMQAVVGTPAVSFYVDGVQLSVSLPASGYSASASSYAFNGGQFFLTSATSATAVLNSGYVVSVYAYGNVDRMSSFTVTVPQSSYNGTQGLMGSYDGSSYNDLTDASGRDWRLTYPNNVDMAASACMQTFAVQAADSYFVYSQPLLVNCSTGSTAAAGTGAATAGTNATACSISTPAASTNAVNTTTAAIASSPAPTVSVPAVWANTTLQAAAQVLCTAAVANSAASVAGSLYNGCLLDVYVVNSTSQSTSTSQLVQSVQLLNLPPPALSVSSITPGSGGAVATVVLDMSVLNGTCSSVVYLSTPSLAAQLVTGNSTVCVPVLQVQNTSQGAAVWSDVPLVPVSTLVYQAAVSVGAYVPAGNYSVRGAVSLYSAVLQMQSTLAQTSFVLPSSANASLCLLFYSLAGDSEYPWSSAVQLSVQYGFTTSSSALGTAVPLIGGSGTRTFTNKFGQASTVAVTLLPVGAAGSTSSSSSSSSNDNLLYLGSSLPFGTGGIAVNLSSSVTLPGHGPSQTFSQLSYYRQTDTLASATATISQTYTAESGSSRIDPAGSAFLSTVSGFTNATIGGGNANIGAVQYASCSAPITFANGLRTPVIANTFNGAVHVAYSYFISDNVTYSIAASLTLTMDNGVANHTDALQNQYQQVVGVTGTRTYVYLPSGATIVSSVSGLSTAANAYADQRFYPFALLGSAAAIYTTSTAPFVDYDGISFNISPGAPAAGQVPGNGSTIYNQTSVYTQARELSPVLVDNPVYLSSSHNTSGPTTGVPLLALQQQSYTLL